MTSAPADPADRSRAPRRHGPSLPRRGPSRPPPRPRERPRTDRGARTPALPTDRLPTPRDLSARTGGSHRTTPTTTPPGHSRASPRDPASLSDECPANPSRHAGPDVRRSGSYPEPTFVEVDGGPERSRHGMPGIDRPRPRAHRAEHPPEPPATRSAEPRRDGPRLPRRGVIIRAGGRRASTPPCPSGPSSRIPGHAVPGPAGRWLARRTVPDFARRT